MGIVKARNRLLRAARALAEQGTTPPAIDPASHRVRSASFVKPANQLFAEAVQEVIEAGARPGMAHLSI
jgi:hypothetical protein